MVAFDWKDKEDERLLRVLPIKGEINAIEDMMNLIDVLQIIMSVNLDTRVFEAIVLMGSAVKFCSKGR